MRAQRLLASLALAIGLLAPVPAEADPRSDAEAVVNALVSQEIVDVSINAIQPLFRQALMGDLSKGEAAGLSPGSREMLISMFLEELRVRFLASMRGEMVRVYIEELQPADLAALRAFLATPAGRAFAAKQPQIMRRGSQVGEKAGRSIGPLAAQSIGQRLNVDGNRIIPNPSDLAIARKLFPTR